MSTTEQRESTLRPAVLWFLPAFLLVIALGDMPYTFYDILRIAVCGAAIWLAIHDCELRRRFSAWTAALILLAVLFNPLFPVRMTRAEWAPVDLGAALFLAVHYVSCRRRATRGQTHGTPAKKTPARQPRRTVPQPPTPPEWPKVPAGGAEPPTAGSTLPPNARLNEYQIVRELGAGGFGITYLAYDHNLNGPVALKEYFYAGLAMRGSDGSVSPISTRRADNYKWGRDRFLVEAQTLTGLNHPNIVRVRRFFEANNTAYIVMDYVEGEPLSAFLERHGTLNPEEWRPWLEALLDGLEHVHGKDYLHRDIKPDNIVLRVDETGASQPVLIDFGAARRAAADKTPQLTAVHTPRYAPLEQYSSTSRQGPFTDIYSLAAVSYRALAGEPPPNAADRVEKDAFRQLTEHLKRPDDPLLAAIDSALAVRAVDRPQTVSEWRALMREPATSSRRRRSIPQRRTLRVTRVGRQRVTSKGNRFVECETDTGTVAFWGKREGPDNINLLTGTRAPFTVTCGCKPARWNRHALWVRDDEPLEIEGQPERRPLVLEEDDIPF